MRPMVWASIRSTSSAQVLGQSWGQTEGTISSGTAHLDVGARVSRPPYNVADGAANRRDRVPVYPLSREPMVPARAGEGSSWHTQNPYRWGDPPDYDTGAKGRSPRGGFVRGCCTKRQATS